jgi:hypothetical protein
LGALVCPPHLSVGGENLVRPGGGEEGEHESDCGTHHKKEEGGYTDSKGEWGEERDPCRDAKLTETYSICSPPNHPCADWRPTSDGQTGRGQFFDGYLQTALPVYTRICLNYA